MKWSQEQICILIEAYREQSCLYAISSPNYHNKYIRSTALGKVVNAVKTVRPDCTEKDCTTKFHNLRTQYNIEKSKVKASMKSGTRTDNIYHPSLWYFNHLKFLDAHYVPRKSMNSLEFDCGSIVEQFQESQNLSQVSSDAVIEDEASLLVECILPSPPVPFIPEPTPAHPSSPVGSPSPSPSTSTARSVKRKCSASFEDGCIEALKSVAASLAMPVVVSNQTNIADESINGCLVFIGSVLKSLKNENTHLNVIQDLMQRAVKARVDEINNCSN